TWPKELMEYIEQSHKFSEDDTQKQIWKMVKKTYEKEIASDVEWEKNHPPERWPERKKELSEKSGVLRRVGKALSNLNDRFQEDKKKAGLAATAAERKKWEALEESWRSFSDWLDRDEHPDRYRQGVFATEEQPQYYDK
ncbi:MAG: hypothetical protein Q9224_005520, partial [Gallowayella concinna]